MKWLLSYLLHHANRETKDKSFYAIKDALLKKYGKQIGYDIQHIPGKKCHSCGGTGQHAKYSMYKPYKIYDYADCYHCLGGWYKFPQWICLARIQFGKYIFHTPLKREYKVSNPWTENEMGWKVSETPVIEGYIDHNPSPVGMYALLALYFLYDRKSFHLHKGSLTLEYRYKYRRFKNKLSRIFTWNSIVIEKPLPISIGHHSTNYERPQYEELPF